MRDYRCEGCGASFEALSHTRTLDPIPCSACGEPCKPLLSVFGLKVYKVDRSNFAMIAPRGPDGKPMRLAEAHKAGLVDSYRPGEHERMLRHEEEDNARREKNLQAQAKREAFREVQQKTRTVIRG